MAAKIGESGVTWAERLAGASGTEMVLWLAVLAVLTGLAAYAIEKTRPKPVQKEPEAVELLSKFRDSYSRGDLSDAEFRTIKTTLVTEIQRELKDNDETP